MNTRKLLVLFSALLGLAVAGRAQSTQVTEATVAKVTGAVSVTLPDGSTVAMTEGMKIPQGATIKTGDAGDVFLETHKGYVTHIVKDSEVSVDELNVQSSGGKVTAEVTTLSLKNGNLVAKLDPSKKAVNNYQVRTPKGVAAARGTVFTVQYKGGNYTIAVVNGSVTIVPQGSSGGVLGTNLGVRVNPGQALHLTQGTDNLNNLSPQYYSNTSSQLGVDIRELLAVAVATVTVAAQNNIGGTTAAEAADVAKAVFTAVPGAAEQAGALIAQTNKENPPKDAAAAAAVLQEVTTATPAAAQSAFTSGTSTGTYTPNPNTTTTSNNGTNSGNTDSSNKTTTPTPIDTSTISRSN